ncbi:hypothetical protein [Candidatus Kryptobacter tengchongensis]|uniref:Uncharacterized protein n=1 Tax=Kryptobacter tengchongensis TaxID=1643429 RepID=A0A656DBF6_KRYT1|nr:hypothetical protein [Candidatus Kryptobacter tengchongensis]CUT04245.1 hypothetical protein JGI24_01455 [Candidatus Kryptobacter tengchongensis]
MIGIIFTLVNYSKAQTKPTRVYNFIAGRYEPTPVDCFDDIVIEPPH